uniref:Retinol dehydrogenase 14-like n=1 Tax=Ciona intestinalis TaxID=7719 RepID=F6S855_CIOIN|nr:retinol dehydrogenase 14-like [Ciona intestinalis]|eukprot:XP_002128635.1 retinol dehydrogenase 14-like [Ciona intestinalis]
MEKSARGNWVISDVKMTGKTVVITGANTGIGLETAIDLVKREARVILGCRNMAKAEEAKQRIITETGGNEDKIILKQLDLASFASVRAFAKDVNENESRIDVLLNNAGIMLIPKGKTEDGFELHYGVNHLGHFLLTNLLLDLVKKSAPSRIINVSSEAHRLGSPRIDWDDMNYDNNYSASLAYNRSKLMNILFTRELSRRLEGTKVTANSLHPGVVRTELSRHMFDSNISMWRTAVKWIVDPLVYLFGKTPVHGAQTNIYLCIAPEVENVSGKYFKDCAIANENGQAKSDQDAKRLWDLSVEVTGLSEGS